MNKPLPPAVLAVGDSRYHTHQVLNQAHPASGFNAFSADAVLSAAIAREAPWAAQRCAALGAVAGDESVQELARLANRHTPELKTHDRFGHRIDWVDFHPSWHQLMSLAWQHEVPSLAWRTQEPHGHFARAVLSYLWNQVEQGTACPTGMAYASYAGFAAEPALAIWAEKARGAVYEFSRKEVGQKPSVVIGYAMTEKQGGSDLRETQTTARFSHSADYHGATAHWYELMGHKWFCSVPQSDGFFTLAKVDGGVTCFFLPRTLPDGSFNRFFVQRLKDKAGNKSNASSEVEYAGTLAIRVGAEGHGIREILSHAHLTRLDFAVGSAGLMRQALTLALQHTTTRGAFGSPIAERPMMANVLADMAVEVEAATLMALRVARATDLMDASEHERLLARVATPAAKFFNCSRAPAVANEALQCHGGNGFIEENPMARLYREAPLNSVWEGTANMMCMDVRRAMLKDPRTMDALWDELRPLAGQDSRFDALVRQTEHLVQEALRDEFLARPMTEAVARVLQGAELLRHTTTEVSDVFLGSRQAGAWGCHFGTLAQGTTQAAAQKIVQRARVAS
ncbi:acyl-CoA dehydrogenase family protein [Paenacidovorax monticola]|uniref:Acyl-CoA dehydrogenase family protein n=1 Tax=Paenacidovorax monticola TaxID=1926868 RepID=A0A7H0HI12_9BURK|nr:acyl-CoA dehydrogenase family protein [Paenacidovorax monticola]QNP60178.1 acyl-CoA dehydrogenase family protein [Paenacidovorax monticola]